jgi:hypothetical protein
MSQGAGASVVNEQNKVKSLESGIDTLAVGMAGWLGIMTIAAVVVFVIVYKRLGRNSDDITDAETGSVDSSHNAKTSIVDFDSFPSLRDADLGTPERSCMDDEDNPSDLPQIHTT